MEEGLNHQKFKICLIANDTICVLTAQVWLCGGSVEVVPCSRIAHIERAHKPYALDLTPAVRRNALRVAEIWLDDYKKNVFISWNLPLKVDTVIVFTVSISNTLHK